MTDIPSPVMLIAGGTGSIGRVIAAHALRAGWRVVLHGSSTESATAALAALDATPEQALALGADLRTEGAAADLVARAAAWAGQLDALVDSVSTGPAARIAGLFAQTEPEGYGAWLDLSVGNLQRMSHAALPWLGRQGGTIVAFASDAGRFAAARQALIGASRAAVMGFVRNLAVEAARDGVRVHCVSPSFVRETDSARRLEKLNGDRVEKAARRAGLGLPTPEDIAPLVLFLCGPGAARITGQVISVNGGMNA